MNADETLTPSSAGSHAELRLGPMLRFVSDTAATIWVETTAPCEVTVLDAATSTFTVAGHHYALVVIDGLAPGTTTPYEVRLDGRQVWPLTDSRFPPSVIRTIDDTRKLRALFGSCRAAGPHEAPYNRRSEDGGLGVDAFRANGLRMVDRPPETWPDVLIFLGDQVYADAASPTARRRIERRAGPRDVPDGVVADFEEYTWLYEESWQPEVERWVMSTVPSVMIFDDHDVIDDWNTSMAWVEEIRAQPWWQDHMIGALMSYWIYQHLGNLSPRQIDEDGMLARLLDCDDAESILRAWAFESEAQTPVPGGYRFSFHRRFGDVHLVMVDTRNGRVLDRSPRRMVGEDEWSWIVDRCNEPCRHLIIATSLPVFTPGGIHGLQQWDEALCAGAWGRPGAWIGEKIRRALDTEHWPAFQASFLEFEQLLVDRATGEHSDPPETITVLGGDIHFSYGVAVEPRDDDVEFVSRVHQVVSSPIRNILSGPERRVMRFALSDTGRWLGQRLQRLARRGRTQLRWDLDVTPIFDNTMAQLEFDDRRARLLMERATLDDDGVERLDIFEERML